LDNGLGDDSNLLLKNLNVSLDKILKIFEILVVLDGTNGSDDHLNHGWQELELHDSRNEVLIAGDSFERINCLQSNNLIISL
jgi:hypothetical protein